MSRLTLALVFGCALTAQPAAPQKPAFEVASVKRLPEAAPNGSTVRFNSCTGGPGTSDPGLYACRGLALETLIQLAYKVLPGDLSAPGWMESERYDIFAKPPAGATAEQMPLMLRTLLEDRLGLEIRREAKTASVYELRAPKGGAKLKPGRLPDQPEDPEAERARGRAAAAKRKTWAPGISAALIGDPRMSMASLAHVLSKMLDRAVVDKTGLEGVYEIDLLFAKTASPSADAEAPHAPTIFEALDEIGLKLAAGKGEGEKIVAVSARKEPRENYWVENRDFGRLRTFTLPLPHGRGSVVIGRRVIVNGRWRRSRETI